MHYIYIYNAYNIYRETEHRQNKYVIPFKVRILVKTNKNKAAVSLI